MMQSLRDYIVSLDFWEDDMIQIDVSNNIQPTVDSYLKGEIFIFLAVDNNKVCGFILGRVKDNNDEGSQIQKLGSIGQLYVKPEYQKKGIGKLLLRKIETVFQEHGATHTTIGVFAGNIKAVGFYEHYGFEQRLITMMKKIGKS